MSESGYPIPAGVHRVRQTIRRSRFITTVSHAPESDAAREFVRRIRGEFPDATHHCWAFAAGPPGSTAHVGRGDDGEPRNTAGQPMLNGLLHGGVGEIVAVCTRYFGGVKLGTGGLSRAYSSGVKLALDTLPTAPKVDRVPMTVVLGYESVTELHRIMTEMGVLSEAGEYGAQARFRCSVPTASLEGFTAAVADASGGTASVTKRRDGSA